jgi:hypothetical protein
MMLKIDEFYKMSLFIAEVDSGKTSEEAGETVKKYHPFYGDLNDETNGKGDDRPLPLELKDRINLFIEKQSTNPGYKEKFLTYSSFNSFIRDNIRKGKI